MSKRRINTLDELLEAAHQEREEYEAELERDLAAGREIRRLLNLINEYEPEKP